jgi:type IV secretory pathway TraG/TraD family ATPase VirD4
MTFDSALRNKMHILILGILVPFLIECPLGCIHFSEFYNSQSRNYIELPVTLTFIQNLIYGVFTASLLLYVYFSKENNKFSIVWIRNFIKMSGIILVINFTFQLILEIIPYEILAQRIWISTWDMIVIASRNIEDNSIKFLPMFVLVIFITVLIYVVKRAQFDETTSTDTTSGNFGTAAFAKHNDLKKKGFFQNEEKYLSGICDNTENIFLPLLNKLTISPQGGGKTTASSIPILLSYDGPAFVFDVKGELWSVTARHRREIFKRDIVVIDPFGVTKNEGFKNNKSADLLKEFKFNPFDWIPEDRKERDRMLNTFAASFVINEGGSVTHFDDNAKILIRGYIDYMMSFDRSQRNLPTLYQIMSASSEEAEITFNQMSQLDGRAGAAANQIKRVGADERGSILSTSYRQIDWMGDSNLQETLSESNFDLADFLKGNTDIFVVLPEDQVKEHNRLFRMILSLLMGMIVTTTPQNLPKKKMLFLLEELAQLGYTPDVEKCIEVLRARGVVVWTVFQTLSQIEMFEKPDLFKGAAIKQIFTNDDTKTMEWIQTLGGKKTVLTKTISNNTGDSRQRLQAFGGTVSNGEGESIHETGVDLIQLNEIRELTFDEQYIFMHGVKPIRCKKVRYFEHSYFLGKFDKNPLEMRN